MIQAAAKVLRPVLEFPIIRRTRRNHALEHATVHMLSARVKGLRVAGRSSDGGFILLGDMPEALVAEAADEAIERLRKGEARWALHPNCGTNLVTTGFMTTLAGLFGLNTGERRMTLDRFSWTMVLMMFAVLFSQPLGMRLQKHITTKGDIGDLEIVNIKRREVKWPLAKKPVVVHNVLTRRG